MTKLKYSLLIITVIALGIFIVMFSLNRAVTYPENKWTRLIEECSRVVGRAREMSGQGIMEGPIVNCQAVGIFPSTISGGFGIGGEYGQGIIMVKNDRTWSSPAVFTLAGGSLGWQIGVEATDIILLFMDKRSIDAILSGKLKLGADASVAAGPIGRNASASTDVQLRGGILSYSISRGLFAGAKLEGAILLQHEEANRVLYGKNLSAREILIENKAPMPKAAYRFLSVLQPNNSIVRFLRKARLIK
jgi:lipid-binding SYLF domain-containing protein